MKVYKIRHIPTGLFFKPSKHGSKSNLSKNGKLYERKPSLKYLDKIYHHPVTEAEWAQKHPDYKRWGSLSYYQGFESRPVIESEWEIVEYTTSE